MVPKWRKDLKKLQKSTNINFEEIVEDIISRNYHTYNVKKMIGKNFYYRVRISDYRIVFFDDGIEVQILSVKNRGDVYKSF